MKTSSRLRFGAIFAVGAMAVTACGSSSSSAKPTGSSQSTQGAQASSPAPGTLRLGLFIEAPSLDPITANFSVTGQYMAEYDTLLVPDGLDKVKPWLATAWQATSPKTWRFTLRTDVVFHDGSKFDATALKANLDRDKKVTGPWSFVFKDITSVDVVNDSTVDVTFTVPTPDFPLQMARIPGAMVSPKAIASGLDLNTNMAGSGGWIFDPAAHVKDSKLVFHANPNYWNRGAVKMQNVELDVIPDNNARLNSLQSGQTDLMSLLQLNQVEPAKEAGLKTQVELTRVASLHIVDRTGRLVPALADPRVRQAIGLLIDRNGFNKAIWAGQSVPTGGFAAPGTQFYLPKMDDQYKRDVAKAKELLAAAGYAGGFTITSGTVPAINDIQEAIGQMLAEGNIKYQLVTDNSYTTSLAAGKYAAGYGADPSINMFQWWASRTGPQSGAYNPFKLTDMDDLQALYTEALTATPERQMAIFDQLQHQVIERGIDFPLSQWAQATAWSKSVKGVDHMILGDEVVPRPLYLSTGG